jgi:hypothetical protein
MSRGFLGRLDEAVQEGRREAKDVSPSLKRKSDILERATEYLFDIFDANCMEEYHILNNFEERAMLQFPVDDADKEEITFEQERLHNEFLTIFEDLLEKFLNTEGISSSSFFELVRENFQGGTRMCQAIEIVDVIFCYCDITQWHAMMRETARQRVAWEKQRTALQAAAEDLRAHGKESHRLDGATLSRK